MSRRDPPEERTSHKDSDEGDEAGPESTSTSPPDPPDSAVGSDASSPPSPSDRFPTMVSDGRDRVAWAVLGATLLGLLLRVVELGGRVAHWDEGRVAYWVVRYHESGQYYYRPIIHGPFVAIIENYLFVAIPPSDFSIRLPIAVVGGLLPLSALLLRDRLRDREIVALALILAVDPLLVYYSRFMRSDVLAAGFAFAAFAVAVAAIDRRDARLFVPAFGFLALSATAKENALLYVACFAGASVLLLDHRLVRRTRESSLREAIEGLWTDTVAEARRWDDAPLSYFAVYLVTATAVFLAVIVFFYAPRPEFWAMFTGSQPPGPVFSDATVGAWERFYSTWGSGVHQGNPYPAYLGDLLETLAYGSGVTAVFAVVGFLVDGYGGRNRPIIAFAAYWAAASLLGYPVATDIQAPWAAIHVTVPSAILAAVGLGYVADAVDESIAAEDAIGVGVAALVLLAAVSGTAAANADYWNSTSLEDRQVLQYAQPDNDLKRTLEDIALIAQSHEGTDVRYIGTRAPGRDNVRLYVRNEADADQPPAPGGSGQGWFARLPLQWYMAAYGADVDSTPPEARYDNATRNPPPVIITYPWDAEELQQRLDGYEKRSHRWRLSDERIVVLIDETALREARNATAG